MNRNRLMYILLILILLPISVRATEPKGSIELAMRYRGNAVAGSTVTLYDITDLELPDDPEAAARMIQSLGIAGKTAAADSDGTVQFSNMDRGNYLLVQQVAATGYLPMKPFCISIPMCVADTLLYDIQAFPKLERMPETELPQTGQNVWPIWGLLLGGLFLMGLGITVQKRK